MRLRVILASLAAVVIVALVALSLADHLLVDYLWFGRLGYRGVFNTTVGAEIAIFAIVWLVAFVAIFVSGRLRSARATTASGCAWCAAPTRWSRLICPS